MTEPKHLWEADHAYYCNDGNYLKNGYLHEHASWSDFAGDNEAIDFDLNLLFRWDWKGETDDDGEAIEFSQQAFESKPFHRAVAGPGGRDVGNTEHMVTETLIRGMYRYWRDVMEA